MTLAAREIDNPSVSTPIKIAIIHPAPLMQLGLTAALELAFAPGSISAFASFAAAAADLAHFRPGDLVLAEACEWTKRGAALAPAQAAVGLIAGAESGGCVKLFETQGVKGLIAAQSSADAFLAMALTLAAGGHYFPKNAKSVAGLERLSHRQLEILELMTRGLLNKQIAFELGLTEGTVKSHVSAILEKLNCHRRTQAITAFMQSFGLGVAHAVHA